MALLNKRDVIDALTRLGELAQESGETIELLLAGGTLMVLVFETRLATRDVDAVVLAPADAARVRQLAKAVAVERGWADDWLNDAVKGFMVGITRGPIVFTVPGIVARRPAIEQLLAMKLCAWRDDVDIADALRLLTELSGDYDRIWQQVEPYLQPGRELTAKYAFDDLWDASHGPH